MAKSMWSASLRPEVLLRAGTKRREKRQGRRTAHRHRKAGALTPAAAETRTLFFAPATAQLSPTHPLRSELATAPRNVGLFSFPGRLGPVRTARAGPPHDGSKLLGHNGVARAMTAAERLWSALVVAGDEVVAVSYAALGRRGRRRQRALLFTPVAAAALACVFAVQVAAFQTYVAETTSEPPTPSRGGGRPWQPTWLASAFLSSAEHGAVEPGGPGLFTYFTAEPFLVNWGGRLDVLCATEGQLLPLLTSMAVHLHAQARAAPARSNKYMHGLHGVSFSLLGSFAFVTSDRWSPTVIISTCTNLPTLFSYHSVGRNSKD